MSLSARDLELRRGRITGTRIGAIVGLHKYLTPIDVYAQIVEGRDDDVDPDSPDILRGNFLEPALLAWYSHRTGLDTRKGTIRVHSKHRQFAANPDAFAGVGIDYDRTVEAKAPRFADDWGEDGTDQIPEYHVAQVAWEMACADVDLCDVVALIHGELRVYHLERDLELEHVLVSAALKFWSEHIEPGVPPPPDATAQYGDWLKERFPTADASMRQADAAAVEWAAKLREAKLAVASAEANLTEAENQLKQMIGGAAGVQGPGFKITWKGVSGRKTTDWETYAKSLGATDEGAAKFIKTGAGYRRFLPKFT